MSADDNSLANEAESLFREQSALVRTTTHPIVKATLGTTPFMGGLASLLGDVALKRQEIHLRRFLISIAEHIESHSERLDGKLDPEFVQTDEFAATIEAVLQEAARTADEAKLDFLRRFFFSSSMHERPDVTWRDQPRSQLFQYRSMTSFCRWGLRLFA